MHQNYEVRYSYSWFTKVVTLESISSKGRYPKADYIVSYKDRYKDARNRTERQKIAVRVSLHYESRLYKPQF